MNKIEKYIKENKKYIICIFIICTLIYAYRMFFINTGIDNEVITNNYNTYKMGWLSIGRWSLYLTKDIFYINQIYNPYYIYILTILFFSSSSIIISYTLSKIIDNKKIDKIVLLLFGGLFITSPLYLEQFCFSLQSLEVSFALLLVSIAFYCIYKYIYMNEKKIGLIAILLFTYSFGSYQAFIPLVLTLMFSMFLLVNAFNKKLVKNIKKEVLKYIAIFLISFVLYEIISKIIVICLNLDSTYLNNQVLWKKIGIKNTIISILGYMKLVFMPNNSIYYNYSFLIFTVCGLVVVIKRFVKTKNVFEIMSFFAVLLSPFLLSFIEGGNTGARTQFVYPLSLIILIIYLYVNSADSWKKIIIVIAIITGLFQFKVSLDLLYSDQVRYEEDKTLITNIINTINNKYDVTNKEIVFIGKYKLKSTAFELKGETLGTSFFEHDHMQPIGSNDRICSFAKTIGIKYKCPTINTYKKALDNSKKMKVYPEKGYIKSIDNYIIVKLK